MQAMWGDLFTFDANGVKVSNRDSAVLNIAGEPLAYTCEYTVDGWITATGQSALTTLSNQLITALRTPYQDLKLLQDDAANSATLLLNAGSIGGVVCVDGPDFYETDPARLGSEYATKRTFRAVFRAEYPMSGSETKLMSWTESIELIGNGGPERIVKLAINGPPQEQITYPFTEYRAVQMGRAVGYRDYPPPSVAVPFAPFAELNRARRVRREAPERRGRSGNVNFPLTWHFEFMSISPLVGVPRRWPT